MPEVKKRRIRYKKDPWRQGKKNRTVKGVFRDFGRLFVPAPAYRVKFSPKGAFGTDTVSVLRNRVQRVLRLTFAFAIALALLIGALCAFSLVWRVTDVRSEGTSHYAGEALAECSGIENGSAMLGFDRADVEARLQSYFPLLARVDVKRGADGTVTLTAREETQLFYTQHYVNYYLLSGETWRVLYVDSAPDMWKIMQPVYLGLPEEARVRKGEVITYEYLPYPGENEGSEVATYKIDRGTAEQTFAYVDTVLQTVMESELGSRVTGLELSDKYDLWFVVDNHIIVKLGNEKDLDLKLDTAVSILEKAYVSLNAVLDVSVPEKAGIRESNDTAMPAWAAP